VAVNSSIKVSSFSFLVVCNHGEHYEMPCIFYYWLLDQTACLYFSI
jgi:hypothetical protein